MKTLKTLMTIAPLIGLLFLLACGEVEEDKEEPTEGPATVEITLVEDLAQGKSYTLTVVVTGEGIEKIEKETQFTGKDAKIEVNIPFEIELTFTAEIKDKNGTVLYEGTATQSISPETPVTVSISMNQATGPKPATVPVIVEVTPPGIQPGKSYMLTITVTGEGMENMEAETEFTGKNASINVEVPSGADRRFWVEVKAKDGTVLYRGTTKKSLPVGPPVTVEVPLEKLELPSEEFKTVILEQENIEVKYSPKGSYLAIATSSGVQLRDPNNFNEIAFLPHEGNVFHIDFSADDRLLASRSEGGKATVWSVIFQRKIMDIQPETNFSGIALSPDGALLATAHNGKEKLIQLWSVPDGKEVATLMREAIQGNVWELSLSPDGKYLSSIIDWSVILWDVPGQKKLGRLKNPFNVFMMSCAAFSRDGERLAVGDSSGDIQFWKVQSREYMDAITAHNKGKFVLSYVLSIDFSPDNRVLASSGDDGKLKVWNLETQRTITTLEGHADKVHSVSFSPDGKRLASGSWDGTVRIWDASKW